MSATVALPRAPERTSATGGGHPVDEREGARQRIERVAAAAVVLLAAALRLLALGKTPIDPFYAGAVRSMGTSWHAFFVGAYDPSARLAIDKAPVDLWLQVASTKLLGFTPTAMLLPAAMGGALAVAALYDLLVTLMGRRVALAGALALAVLPVSVLTSRSDTMDSVMAALVVGAFAVAARGLRDGRPSRLLVAGALLGVAFEAKLFEALVAALPLAALWWWGAAGSRTRRLQALLGAGLVCAAMGVAWLVALTLVVPAGQRPWAFGSTDGSAWNSTFVYDGWDRLTGTAAAEAGAAAHVPAGPGPLRLLSSDVHLGARLGFELCVAWVALAVSLVAGAWARMDRAGRAGLGSLMVWLALGTLVFSAQRDLRPRYLEAFDPAVAACAGAGLVLGGAAVGERLRRRFSARSLRSSAIVAAIALVAFPAAVSAGVVAGHAQDSGTPGALPPARLAALSSYLRAHQGTARYEAAFIPVAEAGGVIARDGRPVLMLAALGHPLIGQGALARLVAAGKVRTAVVGEAHTPVAEWIRAHGIDVSRAAGQRSAATVFALSPFGAR